MNSPTVAVIGLGLLGSALAERLRAAGFHVVGFDVSEAARTRWRDSGGTVVHQLADLLPTVRCTGSIQQTRAELSTSPAPNVERVDAAADGARIVLSLPDSRIVQQVLAELSADLLPGDLVIDTTTGNPDDAPVRASELAVQGVGYLDATVVGSSEQARAGEAVLLVGGDPNHIRSATAVLNALTTKRFEAGSSGSGARLKLIVNLVLGLNRAVLAEGLSLARACGLDLNCTLEVLQATPAASRVMATKGVKMIREEFTPQARLAQHHKDVELILELAESAGVALPLSELHEQLLRRVMEQGGAELDNSAVIRAWTKRDPNSRDA